MEFARLCGFPFRAEVEVDADALDPEIPIRNGAAGPPSLPPAGAGGGRLPRITRLLALAVRFEGLLQDGTVKDYAELARLGGVSRARITQIMSLRTLAPAIQERILALPAASSPTAVVNDRARRVPRLGGAVAVARRAGKREGLVHHTVT